MLSPSDVERLQNARRLSCRVLVLFGLLGVTAWALLLLVINDPQTPQADRGWLIRGFLLFMSVVLSTYALRIFFQHRAASLALNCGRKTVRKECFERAFLTGGIHAARAHVCLSKSGSFGWEPWTLLSGADGLFDVEDEIVVTSHISEAGNLLLCIEVPPDRPPGKTL